jgi:hypothetical protein
MKNFVIALALLVTGTSFASANCVNGSCIRTPVRKAGSVVLETTKRIVTAPARAVKNVRTYRAYRHYQ